MSLGHSNLKNSQDYDLWVFDFAFSSSLEIPTKNARQNLPPALFPMEVRPGVSLLNITVFSYTEESDALTEPSVKPLCGISVIPHLGLAREVPRMSFYMLQMGATTKQLLENPRSVDKLPFEKEPFQMKIDKENIFVECKDHNGSEIFSMQGKHDKPVYTQELFYFQIFCTYEERLYHGGIFLEADKFEHQKNSGSIGKLNNHSFFQGLDVESLDTSDCYLQMWSKPGTQGIENYLPLRPLD